MGPSSNLWIERLFEYFPFFSSIFSEGHGIPLTSFSEPNPREAFMTEYENQEVGVMDSSRPSMVLALEDRAILPFPGPQSLSTAPNRMETTSMILVDISGKASRPRKKRPSGSFVSLFPRSRRFM